MELAAVSCWTSVSASLRIDRMKEMCLEEVGEFLWSYYFRPSAKNEIC